MSCGDGVLFSKEKELEGNVSLIIDFVIFENFEYYFLVTFVKYYI